jgi:signal transduction histidine kinase
MVVHWHGSKPENVSTHDDTWGVEEWKQKNAELEKLVAERTNELLLKNQELEIALSELKSTQAQLIQKEKLASLGELTAGIAHEIQNPLNFVNNFSEVSSELVDEMEDELKAGNADIAIEIAGDLKQNLSKINHHGKRASSIVPGMLEHSRMNTGVKELTDINKLADEYLRLSYHGMRAKEKNGSASRFDADYELIADKNLPLINVVQQDMGRVLLNLINNAFWTVDRHSKSLRFGMSDYLPKVIVCSKVVDSKVEISVADNGNGIPADILPKIFQPFFTTKPTGEGTGLGLSLSYDIITKGHGGTIEIESMEGEGTTFTVRLPLPYCLKIGGSFAQ